MFGNCQSPELQKGCSGLSGQESYIEVMQIISTSQFLRNRMTQRSRPDLWGASPERAALTRKLARFVRWTVCKSRLCGFAAQK